MAMQNNGLRQEFARIHSNDVLPNQNFGWNGDLDEVVDMPIGTIFRPRFTIRRLNRTASLNLAARLQFQRDLGPWLFTTDVSTLCKFVKTIRFEDDDDSLDLLLTNLGSINDFDNNGYQSEGTGVAGGYTYPSGTGTIRWEPEWSCMLHGLTEAEDSFRFRVVRSTGATFDEGYDQFCRVIAKDPVIDGTPKFKSGIIQAVQMVSKIQSAVDIKSNIKPVVCMESNILPTVNMKTKIKQTVNMKTEIC